MSQNTIHEVSVVIGRFQPFHNGHVELINKALETSDNIIIFIGSCKTPRTIKNPWTFIERRSMITQYLSSIYSNWDIIGEDGNYNLFRNKESEKTIHFVETRDFPYNDLQWVFNIQQKVKSLYPEETEIALIAFRKEDTTDYIDSFPQYDFIDTKHFITNITATDIRNKIFSNKEKKIKEFVPDTTYKYLFDWFKVKKDIVDRLKFEYNTIEKYKKSWKSAPFTPIFVTADNVVVKSGHILVIKRKGGLGNGLLALAGGFINPNETLQDSAIRELQEETQIDLTREELIQSIKSHHVFDNPNRSLRGRTITTAFFYDLGNGELPAIKANDDALEAFWLPICELYDNEDKFFEDHFHIAKYFISTI